VDRFFDVFGLCQARYMFCSEHLESVHSGAEVRALDSNETCAHVFEGHSQV
jgi:hypothetical protein